MDAILREAEASRRKGGPQSDFIDDDLPAPDASIQDDSASAGAPGAAAKPATEGVRFDRYKIKVPEAGENKLPTYRINTNLPIIGVLGAVALMLWIFVPGGIQLLRPQAIPDSYIDASARWTLALTKQRIDRFEEQNGRLPQSLEELDPNLSDIVTFQGLADGGYVLRAPGHRQMLTLKSVMPQERFLGRSTAKLRRVSGVVE